MEEGGSDTHMYLPQTLSDAFQDIGSTLHSFIDKLKVSGYWDEAVVMEIPNFACTLTLNGHDRTDHEWDGNYFMIGGQVSGERILGR